MVTHQWLIIIVTLAMAFKIKSSSALVIDNSTELQNMFMLNVHYSYGIFFTMPMKRNTTVAEFKEKIGFHILKYCDWYQDQNKRFDNGVYRIKIHLQDKDDSQVNSYL